MNKSEMMKKISKLKIKKLGYYKEGKKKQKKKQLFRLSLLFKEQTHFRL